LRFPQSAVSPIQSTACGVPGRIAPDTLEVFFQRPQPMLDFADVGGDCAGAGASGSLKHGRASRRQSEQAQNTGTSGLESFADRSCLQAALAQPANESTY